ncbi:unnamed protein product [Schistosoma mattheei]|uniref:Uncharacterized protein n=1 Tax=Schistosoma mattheei TaxID=31246 RepID=A0A183P431_9TREM|nr:unnamed protein product [Schistosoma mattheei]
MKRDRDNTWKQKKSRTQKFKINWEKICVQTVSCEFALPRLNTPPSLYKKQAKPQIPTKLKDKLRIFDRNSLWKVPLVFYNEPMQSNSVQP